MNELLEVCKELIGKLGPDGYFPAAGAPLTEKLRAAIANAERPVPRPEIGLRERNYPTFIEEHRMLPAKAAHELASMRAVLTTLKSIKENS